MSLTTIGAAVFWTAGLVLALLDTLFDWDRIGALAVLLGAAGATLTVRSYLVQLSQSLRERERNAFELGMDAAERRHLH